MNVILSEAELFAIRCDNNHASQLQDILCIVVVTDANPAARKIFGLNIHPQQLHSIAISKELKVFFKKNSNNSIEFWDCPSNIKWSPHILVNKKSK